MGNQEFRMWAVILPDFSGFVCDGRGFPVLERTRAEARAYCYLHSMPVASVRRVLVEVNLDD